MRYGPAEGISAEASCVSKVRRNRVRPPVRCSSPRMATMMIVYNLYVGISSTDDYAYYVHGKTRKRGGSSLRIADGGQSLRVRVGPRGIRERLMREGTHSVTNGANAKTV